MFSVPKGRAANQPLVDTTFNPPIDAPLPRALVSFAIIGSPGARWETLHLEDTHRTMPNHGVRRTQIAWEKLNGPRPDIEDARASGTSSTLTMRICACASKRSTTKTSTGMMSFSLPSRQALSDRASTGNGKSSRRSRRVGDLSEKRNAVIKDPGETCFSNFSLEVVIRGHDYSCIENYLSCKRL